MKDEIIIHYIWLKHYGCYENFECNFSTEYKFSYNHDNASVSYENHSHDYISEFFNDKDKSSNIDVSVIVGKNGIGKTTLLRFIFNLMHGYGIETECVIVIEKKDDKKESLFWAGQYFQDTDRLINNRELLIKDCDRCFSYTFNEYERNRLPYSKNIRFIYISEPYNYNEYKPSYAGGDDLSFASLLYKQTVEGDEEKHISNPIVRYNHRMLDWILNLFSNEKIQIENLKDFELDFHGVITIGFSYDKEAFFEFYVQVFIKPFEEEAKNRLKGVYEDNSKELEAELNRVIESKRNELELESREYLQTFIGDKGNNKSEIAKNECALAILINIISSRKHIMNISNTEDKTLFDILDNTNNIKDSLWNKLSKVLYYIQNNNNEYIKRINSSELNDNKDGYLFIRVDSYLLFMKFFSNFIEKNIQYYSLYYNNIRIPVKPNYEMEKILNFYSEYKKCISIVEFCNFSMGLSSGEMHLVNMFAKLLHILKKGSDDKLFLPKDINEDTEPASNAVILLDEVEVSYNPEWQRIYFQSVLKFLKEYIAKDTHIQLLIATHSPIILSDIPKQNVVLLSKNRINSYTYVVENNTETFASNIYMLFKNSFFLDESGIGGFALNKLEWIIKEIHSKNPDRNNILKYINLVGDPYIKGNLLQEYKSVFQENDELSRLKIEKALIDEKIAKLESEKHT